MDKIPGSRSGSGRVGVSKNTIRYFRVSFLLSGISGYVRYFQVFLGLPIYSRIIQPAREARGPKGLRAESARAVTVQ